MITISESLFERLEQRRLKIANRFGKDEVTESVNTLAERIIKKKLDVWDDEDCRGGSNSGIGWQDFKRDNYRFIIKRDKHCCFYCSKYLSNKSCTIDHKVSPKRGGLNTLENCVLACQWCNLDKGLLTADEYQYKQLHNAAQGIYPPK